MVQESSEDHDPSSLRILDYRLYGKYFTYTLTSDLLGGYNTKSPYPMSSAKIKTILGDSLFSDSDASEYFGAINPADTSSNRKS
jgi:hypothetical protein